MSPGDRILGALGVVLVVLVGMKAASAQQTPRFQSSVEVTSVDVTVVDEGGRPVLDLKPSDFTVKVDGETRHVVSAEWVPLVAPPGAKEIPTPEGYTGNQNATGGRLILLAVDQPHIRFGNAVALERTVNEFLDHLEPSDRVAAVSFGMGGVSTPLTADRERVKRAIAQMKGEDRGLDGLTTHNIALSEAAQIVSGFRPAIEAIAGRECADLTGAQLAFCLDGVLSDAKLLVQVARTSLDETIAGLRALVNGLMRIDAPKTLVLVSEGLPLSDQELDLLELGSMAAAARTSVYVLQLDERTADASNGRPPQASAGDRQMATAGLEMLASASRGTLLKVFGNGGTQFAQITSELSGYYLIGLESETRDKDGKAHPITVSVDRRGLTVRSRRQLQMLAADVSKPLSPRDSVIAALTSPLPVSTLPLRVATFSVREPENAKVQVIIHLEIGDDYASTEPVSLAYTIVDGKGRMVESQAADARLSPVMRGVPSALQFTSTVSLEPGEYTLRLGAADGDRVGTVEHRLHAGLVADGPVTLSDFIVGGPTTTANLMQPMVGYRVAFGVLQGYLEAYGPAAALPSVKYEIATAPDAPALLETPVSGMSAGRERTVFSQTIAVRQLPPGKYVLRAVVSSGDTVKTMTRPFDVVAPAVLMTSAALPSVATTPGEIYLPVADELFVRKFRREDATRGETVRAFRQTIADSARSAFDAGVSSLSSGDYSKAEQSFKSVIRPDSDVTAPMAYLAAVYALSGNDAPAAGAWQTALVEGSSFPQIYEWLGDTLIRSHELAEARTVLEEASAKWPADLRFTKPLALVYAVFGQGREAVRTLERYLAAHAEDGQALSLGVEWIFHLHSAGAAAHTQADDLKLARGWADAYAKTKGSQGALVKEWIQALDREQHPAGP